MPGPTPIPDDQKAAFIALVSVAPRPGGPQEADRLEDILNNFEDISTAIGRQLSLFSSNNAYLSECMAVFAPNDSDLQAVGIYVNKSDVGDVDNPVLVINSAAGLITMDDADIPGAGLINSSADEINVRGIALPYLYVESSQVNVLAANGQGSSIGWLTMPFYKKVAAINSVADGSVIDNTRIDPRNTFGGNQTVDPTQDCAKPVTALTTSNLTHNSITINWTLPDGGGYLFLNVYFKVTGTPAWVPIDDTTGSFIDDTGYLFNNLAPDTMYDFRVSVTCNNGGVAPTDVSDQTTCCPGVTSKTEHI